VIALYNPRHFRPALSARKSRRGRERLAVYVPGAGRVAARLGRLRDRGFFTYSEPERRVIDDERRPPALKLALALQIGFLRMTGRLLEALGIVAPVLWRHLGA
jgi:hypothetical protein